MHIKASKEVAFHAAKQLAEALQAGKLANI